MAIDFQAVKDLAAQRDAARFQAPAAASPQPTAPAPAPFVPQQIIAPKPTPFVPPNLRNTQPDRAQKTAPFNLATVPLTPMGAPTTARDLAGLPKLPPQPQDRFSAAAQSVGQGIVGATASIGETGGAVLENSRRVTDDSALSLAIRRYEGIEAQMRALEHGMPFGAIAVNGMPTTGLPAASPSPEEASPEWLALEEKRQALEEEIRQGLERVGQVSVDPNAFGQRWLRESREAQGRATEGMSTVPRMLTNAGISIAQNLPFMAASVATGSPAIGMAGMGAIAAGSKMGELNEQGVAPHESFGRGVVAGAIEAATEMIPLDNVIDLIRSGGKSVIVSLLKQSGIEATEEGISYVANYLADKANNDPNASFSVAELLESAATGGLSGLFFGAGGAIGGAVANQGSNQAAAAVDTASGGQVEQQGAAYRATLPENVDMPTVPLIELSMDTVAEMNNGVVPESGGYLRKTAIERAKSRLGLNENQAAYIPASNVLRNGEEYILKITKPSLSKMLSPTDGTSVVPPESVLVMENLERIANNGVWFRSEGDRSGRGQVLGYDHLMTTVYIDNAPYLVDMRVRVAEQGLGTDAENRLYYFTPEEIVSVKSLDGNTPAGERHAFTGKVLPSSDSIVSPPPASVNPQNMEQAHSGNVLEQDLRRRGIIPAQENSGVANSAETAYNSSATNQSLSHAEGGDSVGATRAGNTDSVNADYYEALENSGQMPFGENPHRQVLLPNQDIEGNNISRSARTVLEAQATPSEAVDTIGTAAVQGELSYLPVTNDNTSERARNRLRNNGFTKSLGAWESAVESGTVSADLMAMGAHLYNNAVNSGDMKTAVEILVNYQSLNTNAAQALQAARILKTLSPENKLYALDATVRKIVDSVNNSSRYQEQGVHVKVDPALTQEYAQAQDDAGRDAALNKIYENIASQIPSTFSDRWNAWRYLAMLGNPRTHIRNIIGNVGFVPMRQTRNAISAGAENVMSRFLPNMQRTRSILNPLDGADRSLWNAARSDAANVQSELLGEGKYQERFGAIENARTIFNNRVLEAARRGNSNLLELEDAFFSQRAYADALGGYLKANGIDAQTLTDGTVGAELLDRARAFAIKEAQEATYRDSNAFSDAIARRPKNKVFRVLTDAVLPFRKTPANLVMRGIEYSPVGLVKGIYDGLTQVSNGNMTANQVIDEISAGLTGTGVLALGAFLRSMGILVGGGTGDDEQDEMNRLQGVQDYALQIGDTTYTMDWLAPASMPLFVGVALYDTMTGENGGMSPGKAFDAVLDIADPMVEMSMLQSLEEILDNVSYEDNKIGYVLGTAAASYISQAVPTVLGQVARTMDGGDRRGYIQGDSDMPRFFETAVQRTGRRIPFVSANYERYVDAWGRTAPEQSAPTRAILNTLSPGFLSTITTTAADEEIQRLYDSIGATLTPSSPAKSYQLGGQTYYLTGPEFSRFSITKGQTSLEAVEALMQTDYYQGLPDDEKAKSIERAYELATYIAKREFFESRNIEYSNSTWDKSLPALEAGVSPATLIEYRGMLTDTSTATKTNVWAQTQGDSSLNAAQREALNDTIDFQSDKFLNAWPEVQALGLSADDYAQAWQINGMNSEELGALVLEAGLAREQVVRNLVAAKDAVELKRKLLLDMGMDRATVNQLLRLI